MKRAPSEFILNRYCARCGCMVNKWHQHWTDDANKGDAVTAQSEWMK